MSHSPIAALLAFLTLASCGSLPAGTAVVKGAEGDDLLKLRAGPGLGYRVVLGLPNGTALHRGACVTELGQLWCKVSLTDAPKITGFVSADYLETR